MAKQKKKKTSDTFDALGMYLSAPFCSKWTNLRLPCLWKNLSGIQGTLRGAKPAKDACK